MDEFKPMNWSRNEKDKTLSQIAVESYKSPLGNFNWYQEKILRFGSSIWMIIFAILLIAQIGAQINYLALISNQEATGSSGGYLNIGVVLGMFIELFIVACIVLLVVASVFRNLKWVQKTIGVLNFVMRLIIVFIIIGIVFAGFFTVLTILRDFMNALIILAMLLIQYFYLTRFFASVINFLEEVDRNVKGVSIRMANPNPIRIYLWIYFGVGLLAFFLTLAELSMIPFYNNDGITGHILAYLNINALLGVVVIGYSIVLTHVFVKRCPNQPIPLES